MLGAVGDTLPEEVRRQIEPRVAEVLRSGRAESNVEVVVPPAPGRPRGSCRWASFPWAGMWRASASPPST
ncbi:hypothetical protein ACFQU7_15800 [Pseudoroseomonas wenyumeiae]